MTDLYRLRPLNRLLGESGELKEQIIYFPSLEELNDPLEGFRDIVWQGDLIVWTNLFRHYLYCFYLTYNLIRLVGDSRKIEPQEIPVMGRVWESFPENMIVTAFGDICERVLEKTHFQNFITKIAQMKRKARRDEVLLYLQLLHGPAFDEIRNADIAPGVAPNGERREKHPSVFSALNKLFDLALQIEDERFLDGLYQAFYRLMEDQVLGYRYHYKSASKSPWENNRQLLVYDFPGAYLTQLERVLYPDCYVASFMRDYRNASVWGHYGDGHEGVCLIFGADTTGERSRLTLNQRTDHSPHREPCLLPFHDVNYKDKADEIDFFRSIGRFPVAQIEEVWYRDEHGNLSECGAHLKASTETWRRDYWERFHPALSVKTQDWAYEQESRLILHSLIGDLSEKEWRVLTYNFSSLKGIIFGIRTPDTAKLEIIETIAKKCRKNNQTDFKFFQAYYCQETGHISRRELDHTRFL